MKWLRLAALCALLPTAAYAQQGESPAPAETPASPYAVSVETLRSEGARGGQLLETGAAAGGYRFAGRTFWVRTSANLLRNKGTLNYGFRFLKADSTPVVNGACQLKTDGVSALGIEWNLRTSQLFACEFEGRPADQYTAEIVEPAFNASGVSGGFGIGGGLGIGIGAGREQSGDTAAEQAALKARLLYAGAKYEATPTGFIRPGFMGKRAVQGFTITRDGAAVGRIDFNGESEGAITLPVGDADGREAVLFMTLLLQGLPDLYAPYVRETLLNR